MPIYTGPIDNILGSRDMHWKPGPTAPDSIKNRDFYTLYNEETGETEVKERNLLDPTGLTDTYLGKWDKNKKFIPVNDLLTGKPIDAPQQQYFGSADGTKVGLKKAQFAAKKDLMDNGSKATGFQPVSEAEATKLTKDISNPNTATQNTTAAGGGATTPATTTPATTTPKAKVEDMAGTRNNFGDYMYPLDIGSTTQDILKIHMMKWEKPTNAGKGTFGFQRGGFNEKRSIGSVILPIPGGIKDSNKTKWGGDDLNALKMAAFDFAKQSIETGAKGAGSALDDIGGDIESAISNGRNGLTPAVATAFAGAAIGKDFNKLSARFTGQIMNPNMELLFQSPTLRPFSFSFLLAPRNSDEAKQVIQIIRFFKQGMSPIRSKANLFLKAPHTFQLQYKLRGKTEHPYLNKFKECALTACNVNYTPEQSYSTYEDGVMTAYQMSLEFQELEPIYNDDYENTDKTSASSLTGGADWDLVGNYSSLGGGPGQAPPSIEIGY